MNKPVVIVGGGGHAKVVADLLSALGRPIRGVVAPEGPGCPAVGLGLAYLGDDDALLGLDRGSVALALGVGGVRPTDARRALFERLKAAGFSFATLCHPSAVVAGDVELGEGSQIMAGAVVQTGCRIGANVIVNTRVALDHDCLVGDHVHLATAAAISGGVAIGAGAHLGTGAVVIQGLRIGAGALVAAGAVVVADVAGGAAVAGVPARPMGGGDSA